MTSVKRKSVRRSISVICTCCTETAIRDHATSLLSQSEETFAEMFRRPKATGDLAHEINPDRLATRLQAEIMGFRSYAEKSWDPLKIKKLAEDLAKNIKGYRT